MSGPPSLRRVVPVPTRPPGATALDLPGRGLDGDPRVVEVVVPGRVTLLLFLGTACDGCAPFWSAACEPALLGLGTAGRVVALVRDTEDPVLVREATGPAGAQVVAVPASAWRAYGVHGPPFFCLVGAGRVLSEGVAWSVEQVAADVRRALRP